MWLFLHSGSRGVGNKIAQHHITVAADLCRRWWIRLPDPDLAHLVEGTDEFWAYIRELRWAQDFALLNREEIVAGCDPPPGPREWGRPGPSRQRYSALGSGPVTQEDDVVDEHVTGILVFPSLDPGASGAEAARIDRATGLLTPVHRTWRHRPVVLDGKARTDIVGRKNGVDLRVERANGWRCATIPLVEVGSTAATIQSLDLVQALAAEVERRAPDGSDDVVALLQQQIRYMKHESRPAQTSPLAMKVAGLFERFARLGL